MFKHTLLLDEETIRKRVSELAQAINADYSGRTVDIVCILKGAMFFVADLTRHISLPVRLHFIEVSSYQDGMESSGTVTLHFSSIMNLEGCHVLLIEDILDTGITLDHLMKHLNQHQPSTLKICVLLNKPDRRRINVRPDYLGFEIPDRFVIGYGLDFRDFGRNLPYLAMLEKEES